MLEITGTINHKIPKMLECYVFVSGKMKNCLKLRSGSPNTEIAVIGVMKEWYRIGYP